MVNDPLRKVILICLQHENTYFTTLSPTLLPFRSISLNSISLFTCHFWLLMKLHDFCRFSPTHTNFHGEVSVTILLPFGRSVASNGARGFSTFSSSGKEFLQTQCQATPGQWSEQNSRKLLPTHSHVKCAGTATWMNTKKHSLALILQSWQSPRHERGGWKSHHLQSAEAHLKNTRA